MAVLRDNRTGIERRRRAQDSPDIMRVSHLIEHNQRPCRLAQQNVIEENIIKRVAFQHQALMRRILGDKPRQIGGLGIFQREILGQFTVERGNALAGGP